MDDQIGYFQKLGLSDYESRVLCTLFKKHEITAQDISEQSEIPYTKIYSVLNSLEKSGLIKTSLSRPKRYSSLSPEMTVKLIIEKKKEQLRGLENSSKTNIKSLEKLYQTDMPVNGNDTIWFLPNLNVVWDTVASELAGAKKFFYISADKKCWEIGLTHLGVIEGLSKQLKRNVRCRLILPLSLNEKINEVEGNWLRYIASDNVTIRALPDEQIVQNIIIVDNSDVGFAFKDPKTGKVCSGVLTKEIGMAKGTLDYFEMLWKRAMPLGDKIRIEAKRRLSKQH